MRRASLKLFEIIGGLIMAVSGGYAIIWAVGEIVEHFTS